MYKGRWHCFSYNFYDKYIIRLFKLVIFISRVLMEVTEVDQKSICKFSTMMVEDAELTKAIQSVTVNHICVLYSSRY